MKNPKVKGSTEDFASKRLFSKTIVHSKNNDNDNCIYSVVYLYVGKWFNLNYNISIKPLIAFLLGAEYMQNAIAFLIGKSCMNNFTQLNSVQHFLCACFYSFRGYNRY